MTRCFQRSLAGLARLLLGGDLIGFEECFVSIHLALVETPIHRIILQLEQIAVSIKDAFKFDEIRRTLRTHEAFNEFIHSVSLHARTEKRNGPLVLVPAGGNA